MSTKPFPRIEAKQLNRVVAIMTYGRSGSGLMYSLLDNHPNVVSTPDCVLTSFYDFWEEYGHLPAKELVPSFVDYYAGMFDAREGIKGPRGGPDFGEYAGFTRLGPEKNERLEVDKAAFGERLTQIIGEEHPVSRRLFFQGLHVAYAEALGREVQDPIIVFGLHTPGSLSVQPLVDDFPDAVFLQMIRHPIRCLGALFRHHQVTGSGAPGRVGACSRRIFYPPVGGPRWKGVRLEDLHESPRETLEKICGWLDLPWDDSLLHSTITGMQWWNENNTLAVSGFSTAISSRSYAEYIPAFDRFRLNVLMASIYLRWGYDLHPLYRGIAVRLIMLPLLMLPFKMEIVSMSSIKTSRSGVRGFIQRLAAAGRGYYLGKKFLLRVWVRLFVGRPSKLQVL